MFQVPVVLANYLASLPSLSNLLKISTNCFEVIRVFSEAMTFKESSTLNKPKLAVNSLANAVLMSVVYQKRKYPGKAKYDD